MGMSNFVVFCFILINVIRVLFYYTYISTSIKHYVSITILKHR